jgi:serine/threonine protein kinase
MEASVVGLSFSPRKPVTVAAKYASEQAIQNDHLMLYNEAMQMQDFNHNNVVRLLGVCFGVSPPCILLEYMANGDLRSYLRAWNDTTTASQQLTPIHLHKLVEDCCHGFAYLGTLKYVHRDLAARNVVLSEEGTAKIGDFGWFPVMLPWCRQFGVDFSSDVLPFECIPQVCLARSAQTK